MLTTATTVAVILLVLGGLLTRLLHFTPGALGIASGIILLMIAVTMVLSQQGGNGGSHPVKRPGPDAGRRVPAGRALPAQPGRDRRPGHLVGRSDSALVVYAVAVGVLVVVLAIDIAVFPPGCPGQQQAGREPDAAPMPRP